MNVNLFVIIIMLLGFVVGLFSPHHPEFLMKGKKTKRSTNVLLRNDNSNIQTELKHLLCDDLKPSLRVAAADQIDNLSFSVSTAITGSQPRGGHTQCRHWTLSSPLRTCLNRDELRVSWCWILSWLTHAAKFLIYSLSQVRVWTIIMWRIHNICRSSL